MKTKLLFSLILSSLLCGVNGANARMQSDILHTKHTDEFGDHYYTDSKEIEKPTVLDKVHALHQGVKKTPKEIIEAFQATKSALMALDQNDTKSAESQLKSATEAFDRVFKQNPDLKNIPVGIDIEIVHTNDTVENIKAVIENSIRMLKQYDTQEAIALISELKDEIDVTAIYIPAELYPISTKTAYEKLKNGEIEDAKEALNNGFNSIIIEAGVIPIGLLESQEAVIKASELEKNNKEDITKYLEVATIFLEKVRLLGYTTKYSDAYKNLIDQIEMIQKEVKGKNEVEKMYDQIKMDFNIFIDKVIGDIPLLVA
jgi:cellobiose-specific phosphotransferase system component IIA